MIVNYNENGWEVITQRAHGLLAAQLALHWKAAQRPQRWMETLLAIAEHDDAEVELDGENLLTEKGGPLNFDMKTFDLKHCEELSRLTLTKSRYIALLTSMHIDFLYRKEEKENSEAATFLAEQRKLQTVWRKELALSREDAEKIYAFMEWCDACSLLICQRQMPPEQRAVEISHGPDKVKHRLYQLDEEQLTLDPWPFEEASFNVQYESRTISQLQFGTSAEFRQAFLEAPVKETTWQVVKRKTPAKLKMTKV
jgi:hypothetical protein